MNAVKRIIVVIIAIWCVALQANAQSPYDSTVVAQDTVAKMIPANDTVALDRIDPIEQKEGSSKDSKKNERPRSWPRIFHKAEKANDCEQCESELEKANMEKQGLQKQIGDLKQGLGKAMAVYDIDDRDFYRVLITTPLEKKYDENLVEHYKKTVELFDHENKEEMKWVYEVYYPLLENYGQYNNDVVILIERVVRSFEKLAQFGNVPDMEIEKKLFIQDLEESEYFKKYRYMGVSSKKKDNPSRRIEYLEDVINDIKSLFEDSSLFTKENFENQMMRLK